MEIKELEIGDEVQIVRGVQRVRDEDDEKWVYEPCFEEGEVIDVYEKGSKARVDFKNGTCTVINADTEWYPIPSNTKIATHDDVVNNPSHYTYGNIEVIDYIEQVTKDYPPELAFSIGNAIKYISRAVHKNGKEDLDKARWYLQRAYDNWEA
ncbi:TPA: DUF3310 domain-containing protein [Staphylococcus pseudintermedius]|nr:DUF3310 domain-containing protein [Staphylococcus pseudintermedius]